MTRPNRIPRILADAMSNPEWPRGRIHGSQLKGVHSIFDTIDIELLQTPDQLIRNHIVDTETLFRFSKNPNTRKHLALASSSETLDDIDLPLLDVEQILVFGGGADIGDDFWLTLDFRTGFDDPRVVGNDFGYRTCTWFELTSTFSEFCRLLDVPIG